MTIAYRNVFRPQTTDGDRRWLCRVYLAFERRPLGRCPPGRSSGTGSRPSTFSGPWHGGALAPCDRLWCSFARENHARDFVAVSWAAMCVLACYDSSRLSPHLPKSRAVIFELDSNVLYSVYVETASQPRSYLSKRRASSSIETQTSAGRP